MTTNERIERKAVELYQCYFDTIKTEFGSRLTKKLFTRLAKAVLIAEIKILIDELEDMKPTASFGDRFNVRIKELQSELKSIEKTEV